jgi:hypothetical protein
MKFAETDADGQIHGRMSYNYNFEIQHGLLVYGQYFNLVRNGQCLCRF